MELYLLYISNISICNFLYITCILYIFRFILYTPHVFYIIQYLYRIHIACIDKYIFEYSLIPRGIHTSLFILFTKMRSENL